MRNSRGALPNQPHSHSAKAQAAPVTVQGTTQGLWNVVVRPGRRRAWPAIQRGSGGAERRGEERGPHQEAGSKAQQPPTATSTGAEPRTCVPLLELHLPRALRGVGQHPCQRVSLLVKNARHSDHHRHKKCWIPPRANCSQLASSLESDSSPPHGFTRKAPRLLSPPSPQRSCAAS